MDNLEKSKIQEIITLHNEIGGYLKMSLEKAIRIGELLVNQKESLKHGEWMPWIKKNLPFSQQTVSNYMRCYQEKDKLLSVGNLTEAYELLKAPKPEIRGIFKEFDEILEVCKVEFEALKILEQKIDEMVTDREKIIALKTISTKALMLQNNVAEIRIRMDREVGKILIELESKYPSIDLLRLMNDSIYSYEIMELINQRLLELKR